MKTSIFRKAVIAFTGLFCSLFYTSGAQLADSSQLPGVEVYTFQSKLLGEKRKIRVQVPAGSDRFTSYPVLYLLDAEAQMNLVSGQVQYLSESYKIIPSMIIVGIDNTDRMRDLTPSRPSLGPDGKPDTSAKSPYKNTGGGETFLQFIKQELMPFIENRYKTAPFRILSGHSLGGLMAVYCLMKHPDYFNAYIAISPSFQWDSNALLKEAAKASFGKEKNRMLFFSDANEDSAFHQNQLTFDSLLRQSKTAAFSYKRMFYPEETHISEPVKAFYDGIRFVYPAWHLPYNSSAFRKTLTSAVVKQHYAQLSKTYAYDVVPPHDDILLISRFLRNDTARIKDAIELLELNARHYPHSVANLDTLGDTFLKAGDQPRALAAYKDALRIDSNNQAIQQKINNLSK
jgi:predicted alpha/beta superfamily hydrolase